MLALKIVFIIITLFVLFISIPIYVNIELEEEVKITLRYLFLKLNLLKKKERKIEKKLPKEEKSVANSIRDKIKVNGISEFIDMIKEISKLFLGIFKKLFSHIIIDRIYLNLVISSNDAADTAMKYGYACSVIFPAMNIITNTSKCKSKTLKIVPNFSNNEDKVNFITKFHIRPVFVLGTAVYAFFSYIKLNLEKK